MRILLSVLLSSILLSAGTVSAWDSVGHRLSAAVTTNFISDEIRDALIEILRAHPRFEEDFVNQIPEFIDQSDAIQFHTWLLGQAAFWPDIARGLPRAAQARFNRPSWHFTDGAWIRGAAQTQGNTYLGVAEGQLIQGEEGNSIRSEGQVHNVVTAIDYNASILVDSAQSPSDRAVALCWVLHLMADIHQPLHTGSLFTASLFENGDRGGNGIETVERRTLHLAWDSALREDGVIGGLPLILDAIAGYSNSELQNTESDWTLWMAESREILLNVVYTEAMKRAIADADQNNAELSNQTLSETYVEGMKNIYRQRLGLAGIRLANFFENALN